MFAQKILLIIREKREVYLYTKIQSSLASFQKLVFLKGLGFIGIVTTQIHLNNGGQRLKV